MEVKKIRKFANGYVMSIKLNDGDGRLIETTNTFLPLSTELRGMKQNRLTNEIIEEAKKVSNWKQKNMIGVSIQAGCPIMCKFCEVNKVTKRMGWRNLTDDEIIEQVELAIKTTNHIFGFDLYNEDPKSFGLLRILFTRMGEPALNIHNVVSAIRKLKIKFQEYPLRIQVSTIGLKGYSEKLVDELINIENEFDENFIELQFSIHSTSNEFRKWLQSPNILTNEEINELAKKFYYSRKHDWKVTLNFTLTDKTPFSIDELKKQFDPEVVFIKLSPLNETETSKEYELHSKFKNMNKI